VVGPRQTGAYGMVLPRFVEAAVAGRALVVHDDGRQVRCFAHVSDVVRAIVALMHSPAAVGRVFNIGSDRPVSILELAEMVIAAVPLPSSSRIEFQSYADAYDADFEDCRRRVPDISRLRQTIGFAPQYDLERIVSELVGRRMKEETEDRRQETGDRRQKGEGRREKGEGNCVP
jgi:UDP-glucose 4-epimerase